MKVNIFIIVFVSITILFCINVSGESELLITSSLDDNNIFNPYLKTNNSFMYNNFEFHIFTDTDNLTYSIEINNITIGNGTIEHFKKVIHYEVTTGYIINLKVVVGNDVYLYSNIIILKQSITNESYLKQEDQIIFSKVEYEQTINKIKLNLFSGDQIGWITGGIVGFSLIKESQKYKIVEV